MTEHIPLLEERRHDAIRLYHKTFGPGCSYSWHLGYLVANIISDLEIYRLRVRFPEWVREGEMK